MEVDEERFAFQLLCDENVFEIGGESGFGCVVGGG